MTTLVQAQDQLKASINDGTYCPCCGKWCKVYPRKLSAQMARFLIRLVRVYARTEDWVHVREVHGRTAEKAATDASYLKHWGLLVPRPKDPMMKSSGYYKPTQLGVDFVFNRILVRKKGFFWNNTAIDWSDATTDINDALGDGFDYAELMAPIGRYFKVQLP